MERKEIEKRFNRLNTLRVLTEGYDKGEGSNICTKCYRAIDKNPFTGIIRLTPEEKDFLGYLYDSEYIGKEDIEVLDFYIKK